MQKIINKSTAIKAVVMIICAGLILSIFPFRIWTQTETSFLPRTSNESVGEISGEKAVTQSFVAEQSHLDNIHLYITEARGAFNFSMVRIYENEERPMFEDIFYLNPADVPGFYEVLVDQILEIGETYKFIIKAETEETALFLGVEWFFREDYPSLGRLYYEEKPWSGQGLAAVYNYTVPLSLAYSLSLVAGVLLLMALLIFFIHRYYQKNPGKDSLIVAEQAVKVVLNPLVIVLVITGLTLVFLQTFGAYLFDNIFFAAAVLIGGGISWYGINHNRDGQPPIMTKEIFKENWPDYLQSILFAGAIYACCEYMCAELNIHHNIAQSKQIIYFGLLMLVMMGWRQIFNLVNLIFLTVIAGYSYYYYTEAVQAGMDELTILELEEIKLAAWVIIVGGMAIVTVFINVITRIAKKEMKPISISFGCLMLLFLSLMVVFRNTREWPILMAVSFTLFYLQYGTTRKMNIVLNICRGLILSFIYMVGYSLLYRPFATFQSVRYPLIFHTVTVTATYLALVAAAALVILLMKMRKTTKLKDLWKECLLLGTVLTYLVFTISNTGIYAFLVTAVFSLLMFTSGKGKKKLDNIVAAAGLLIMSLIICFPVIFFLQRNIPAFVGKPDVYGLEHYHQDITRGHNPDSFEYMRVGRFIEVFADEFLKIPRQFDFYGFNKENEESYIISGGITFTLEEAQELGISDEPTIAEKKQQVESNWHNYSDEDKEYWESVLGGISQSEASDFTNGRLDHFKAYFAELNAFGHDSMSVTFPNGAKSMHAHNIYLQFAYDHGIYMGILFIIFGGFSFIRAIFYYREEKNAIAAALPLAVIVVVATAGLAEWIFHFSNPSGFVLMLLIAPLLFTYQGGYERKNKL
ncbi:MAG: hypothetical protein FWG91_04990 [Lachnospiraceae bacterium]|nr:hypothetical protein [Lachnospiraceae bacterium]